LREEERPRPAEAEEAELSAGVPVQWMAPLLSGSMSGG
jgi:hypothetical protein